jgi:hypothetical protein
MKLGRLAVAEKAGRAPPKIITPARMKISRTEPAPGGKTSEEYFLKTGEQRNRRKQNQSRPGTISGGRFTTRRWLDTIKILASPRAPRKLKCEHSEGVNRINRIYKITESWPGNSENSVNQPASVSSRLLHPKR